MIPIDKLLEPLRDGAPCGDDPWTAGVLAELETAVQGKPETQFSAAEEPDWARLRARALEVAGTTKDLRVAAILTTTLLKTDGLSGFEAGLKLIHGYLEKFWDEVFPRLDETDRDPAERINALANLAAPVGTDGDILKVVAALRRLPLLAAPRAGRFALEHYFAARDKTPWPQEAGPAPSLPLLEAARQEIGAATVQELVKTVRSIESEIDGIEKLFRDKAGPALYPSFEALRHDLKQIDGWLGGGVAEAGADGAPKPPPSPNGDHEPGWSGAVHNRDEVLRALAAIVAYYDRNEPSSPIPFLLKRAARIVPMDFLNVMNELAPESREKIMTLVGGGTPAAPN
jgi:type VI secretion system protein ImpA